MTSIPWLLEPNRTRVAGLACAAATLPRQVIELQSDPDECFVALLDAYRPYGGLLRHEMLAALMLFRGCGCSGLLSSKVAARQILSFEWSGAFWIPTFQFEGTCFAVSADVSAVLMEISDIFDGWSIAQWFVTPNPSLQGRTPISLIEANADAVIDAARLERFIITG